MNQPQSVLRSKTIIYCFIVTVMMIMGVASVTPILPTLARHFGVPTADANLIIVFFTVPGLIVTPLAGIIADRWGAKKVLVPSLLLFGLGGVGSAFMPDFESFLFAVFYRARAQARLACLPLPLSVTRWKIPGCGSRPWATTTASWASGLPASLCCPVCWRKFHGNFRCCFRARPCLSLS